MSKVGIITLNGYKNYGNRLQNYALQEVIKYLEFSVDTIIVDIRECDKFTDTNYSINKLKKITTIDGIKKVIPKVYYTLQNKKNKNNIIRRTANFKKFTEDYIYESNYSISEKRLPNNIIDKYDFFVVGSDQVWNPHYIASSSIYFLTFAPREKRIAYAPSFGVSEIPFEDKENYKKWLSEMSFLSVREQAGADIVKKLTGRDAPVLVDPTLMLTKEKWLSIAKEASNKPKQNYLLTYFLGKIPKNTHKMIESIAKKNNLQIVNLADMKDRQAYITGPSEFIDYINSASLLCTDSFHGCIFSILMETPFIVFDRVGTQSMYSRIDTLLSKFKLESRKVMNIRDEDQVFNVDFSHVPPILERERKKSLDYLKEALNVEKEVRNES